MVEQRTENPCAADSISVSGTILAPEALIVMHKFCKLEKSEHYRSGAPLLNVESSTTVSALACEVSYAGSTPVSQPKGIW